jgi:hypothetical protein
MRQGGEKTARTVTSGVRVCLRCALNNLAERSARPLVIARKISGGTGSLNISETLMVFFSLFGSWAAQGLNPFFHCLATLSQSYPLSQQ